MQRQKLEDAAAVDAEPTIRTFRIKLNGTWVDVPVDIVSLRLALGLPQHDIFSQGIFHEYQHNPAAGPNVADTDHGAVVAAPPPDEPLEEAPAEGDIPGEASNKLIIDKINRLEKEKEATDNITLKAKLNNLVSEHWC